MVRFGLLNVTVSAVESLSPTGPARLLSLAVGIGCLSVAIVDLFWTILWDDKGAGPLSSRLMVRAWNRLRTLGDEHEQGLSMGGPLILALNLLVWVGLIWLGWTLVFAGGENALVHSSRRDPSRGSGGSTSSHRPCSRWGTGTSTPAPARGKSPPL